MQTGQAAGRSDGCEPHGSSLCGDALYVHVFMCSYVQEQPPTTHHGDDDAEAQKARQADGRKAAGSAARHPVQQAGPTLQRRRRLLCHLLCHPRCLQTTMMPCW